ncbi:MAG: Rieske (2Fe-2S) protein [Acidobacteriia bacterium]|nr:Rieske (2Fe-2S) protein [Terriglobia bacterium]
MKVAVLEHLAQGAMIGVEVGENRIAICNVGGQLHAIDGSCPHRNGPLAEGALHGSMVVCPWHAWEFDCTTGQNDRNPDIRQRQYAVKAEAGVILLDADSRQD